MVIWMEKIKIFKNHKNLKLMKKVKILKMENSRRKMILKIMKNFQTKMHIIN